MAEPDDRSLRIVLVGRTGSGKSATANTILGEERFDSRIAAHAVTETCQRASRKWKGRDLVVIDTPGLFDSKKSLRTNDVELSRAVLYSCPGPHAIVLVLRLGRFTEEEWEAVALVKAVFGEAVLKHMIVLFTCKEELEGSSLRDFIAAVDVDLRRALQERGGRSCAFSNRADEAEKEQQVQELGGLIDEAVQSSGRPYFSDAVYTDAEKRLQETAEFLRQYYGDQLEEDLSTEKETYAQMCEESMQEKEAKVQSARKKYKEKIRNIREEAEKNIFSQIVERIKGILLSLYHYLWP